MNRLDVLACRRIEVSEEFYRYHRNPSNTPLLVFAVMWFFLVREDALITEFIPVIHARRTLDETRISERKLSSPLMVDSEG